MKNIIKLIKENPNYPIVLAIIAVVLLIILFISLSQSEIENKHTDCGSYRNTLLSIPNDPDK